MRGPSATSTFTAAFTAIALVTAMSAGANEAEALRDFLNDRAVRGGRVGVVVEDLVSGERILAHEPARPLVPASNQKLLISAVAFQHWGPTHRFETPVYLDGTLGPEGELDGTLWIRGMGDPSLVSESLWRLAEELKLHGVTAVRGGLGIDITYFDSLGHHPDWQPVSARAYDAPTAAFAVNYSAFRIEVRPTTAGERAHVRVAPDVDYFATRSDVVTIARRGQVKLDIEKRKDGSGERVRVAGSTPVDGDGKSYWRSVQMPARYAASVLRSQLAAHGVRVDGPLVFGEVPGAALELFRFEGEAMSEIVRRLNKYSNNFIAETLTKRLGAEKYGAPGTWRKGGRAIEEALDGMAVDTRGVIADGSGLSPRNRVAPATLAAVLRGAIRKFDSGPEFLASLPLGGRDGTLEDRMTEDAPPLRGKTGHLRRVASLSGVLANEDGRDRVFSILVNGARGNPLDVDAAIDRFVQRLALSCRAVPGAAGD